MFVTTQYFAICDLIQILNKIYLKSKETNWDNLKNEMLLRTMPSHKCIFVIWDITEFLKMFSL